MQRHANLIVIRINDLTQLGNARNKANSFRNTLRHRINLDKIEVAKLLTELLLEQEHLNVLALHDHVRQAARALQLLQERLNVVLPLQIVVRVVAKELVDLLEQRLLPPANRLDKAGGHRVYLVLHVEDAALARPHLLALLSEVLDLDATAGQVLFDLVLVVLDALLEVDQVAVPMLYECAWNAHAYFARFTVESNLFRNCLISDAQFTVEKKHGR